MRTAHMLSVNLGTGAIMLLFGTIGKAAFAQGTSAAVAGSSAGDGGTRAAIVVGGFLVLGLVIAGVKLLDIHRKRDDEAVNAQAQISDALLRDRTLGTLPVTPTVHVPMWPRASATIEIRGQVPAVELREAVLRLADHEASRLLGVYRIEDRLTVAPAGAHAV